MIKIPTASGEATVVIDSGGLWGVTLSAARWEEWRRRNSNAPTTISSHYTPADGLTCNEMCWAKQLSIGALSFRDMTVEPYHPSVAAMVGPPDALIGLDALSCFDIIIDGAGGYLYLRPVAHRTRELEYSRSGIGFAPKDGKSGPLLVRVAKGGPAHRAGIRDGDILLKIDDRDFTKWEEDPSVLPSGKPKPAGTRVKMTLERAGKPYTVTFVSEEIFPVGKAKKKRPKEN